MDIRIFEDQTGLMMFPEKRLDTTSQKNTDVIKLFDNKIDLTITNRENEIEIMCYLLIHRGHERAIGCYIIGKDKYSDRTFENFKRDADSALKNIGFEHHHDEKENIVFDHIDEFDRDGQLHRDIDLIMEARSSEERVGYKGGNIGEIATLCRQILKKINDMKIVISTVESNLGYVNIIRGSVYDGQLSPTSQGRQTLDRQIRKAEQRRIEENRKRDEEKRKLEEDENRKREVEIARLEEKRKYEDMESMRKDSELADANIEKGVKLIEEGLEIKRKAGYDNSYIDYNTGIINDVINGKLSGFPPDKVEDVEYRIVDDKSTSDLSTSDKSTSDKSTSDLSTSDKNEKMKKVEIGNNKIHEGSFLVRDAVAAKRRARYTDVDINFNTKINGSCVNIRSYVCPYKDDKCIESDKKDNSDNNEKRYIFGIIPDMKLIHVAAIILIVVIIIVWLLMSRNIYTSYCIPDATGGVCYSANVAIHTMDSIKTVI
jgi:hypothetical protein